MYRFECKDLGFDDGGEITGKSRREVTRKAVDHARKVHDFKGQSRKEVSDFEKLVRSKIKEAK
jgi:predicted small metal-binding protein